MKARLLIEPLRADHLSELAACLRHPQVYEHIGGLPSREDFVRDRERALRGPGPTAPNEHWLNFLVRDGATHEMLGRLEATLHDSIAEVAFLLGPKHWGKGHANEALAWLHREIQNTHAVGSFWATTLPANTRCQALLLRSGYRQVQAEAPLLYSYDPGDLMFHLTASPQGSVQPSPV